MANGKQQVAKKPESPPPATIDPAIPEFMRGEAGRGTENLTSSDYEMPRIKLLQGLSDELQQFDDLKSGEFFHTLVERGLGSAIDVVPVYISTRYVLWRPRHDGGGILARADDGVHWQPSSGEFTIKTYKDSDKRVTWKMAPTVAQSKLAEWGTYDPTDAKSQPAATLCYVVVVALPEHPDISPVALMLQRTAVGPARKFLGKLNFSQAPIYGAKFRMTSFQDDRGGQKFFNYRFTPSGFVTNEGEFGRYKAMYEQFKKTGVQVKDLEDAQDDDAGVSEGAEAAAASEKAF